MSSTPHVSLNLPSSMLAGSKFLFTLQKTLFGISLHPLGQWSCLLYLEVISHKSKVWAAVKTLLFFSETIERCEKLLGRHLNFPVFMYNSVAPFQIA